MPDGNPQTSEGSMLSLDRLVSASAWVGVRQADLLPGDVVIVRTKNSTYALRAHGDGTFDATGGWFVEHAGDGERLRIAGCTWGGTSLLTPMVAAPGMFLQFANGVQTTRIQEVRHLRPATPPTIH